MTLPALATIAQLEERLGHAIDPSDIAPAEALLRYASSLVRSYAGRTWLDSDGHLVDVADGAVEVCVEIVYRAVTNPTGVTQDTVGPFTVSFGSDAAQRMYLTRSDRTILAAARRGAFTIDPTPAAATPPGRGCDGRPDLGGEWL